MQLVDTQLKTEINYNTIKNIYGGTIAFARFKLLLGIKLIYLPKDGV